jgi:tellurite resistance protein
MDPRLEELFTVVDHLQSGRRDDARRALTDFVNSGLELDRRPEDLRYFLLAAGLSKRADGAASDAINLYLRDYDVPQIRLFNLLAERVPTMALGTMLSNKLLVRAIREHEQVSLVDFGTGTGRQMASLLRMLRAGGRVPKRLTLTLIEPDATSLRTAIESVTQVARECEIAVEIQAIPKLAEELDDHDWALIARAPGSLIANESFTLHHVEDDVDGSDGRGLVLSRLRALEPELFVATEPDVDHFEPDLRARLAHCDRHFRAMFAQLDRLSLGEHDRNAIKVCFFGREIEDILGAPEATRAERHERAAQWIERLREAGFRLIDTDDLSLPAPETLGVELFARDGHLSLGFEGEPLLAILAASGRGGGASETAVMPGRMSIPSPRATHAPFDAAAHLAVLASVALADGAIDSRERAALERHARLTGADLSAAIERANDLGFLSRMHTSERTRRAILRDCIVLAKVDGAYSTVERERIAAIAKALGMPESAVADAERRADSVAPPMIERAPGWLQDYWALATKR